MMNRFLLKHPYLVVFSYIVSVCMLFLIGAQHYSHMSKNRLVRNDARLYAQTLNELQNYYSREIVPRAAAAGTKLAAHFRQTRDQIPFPATLTNDFGRTLNKSVAGLRVRLYSNFPIWWDKDRKLSELESNALDYLTRTGASSYYHIADTPQGPIANYAVPMYMQPSCLECHNSKRFSSGRTWHVGDMRGVREVTIPLNDAYASVNGRDYALALAFAVIAALVGMAMIVPLVSRLRSALTESQALSRQLGHLADRDALTGLANPRLCRQRLTEALATAAREETKAGVMFIDLDGFKAVNDRYGHEAGDAVLQVMAERLSASVGPRDTVGRLGGDEFLVVLVGLQSREVAQRLVQRVMAEVCKPIEHEIVSAAVSTSAGIALYPDDRSDPQSLLRAADQAMYHAKRSGKNRYHFVATRAPLPDDATDPAERSN